MKKDISTIKYKKILISTSVFVLFSLFFLSFLNIGLWDYDFWWHIATGRYIVEHKEIPTQDKFSFVTEENRGQFKVTALRERFLMRQYWLAQVIFYYIYTLFGPWGIVAMRSLLLTLTLGLVYKGLRRFEVPQLFSLSLLIPVFYVFHKYTGERPVLFTFVFAVLTFLLIEDYLKSKGENKALCSLPPAMLIWSNLHGGFIIGIILIIVYLVIESFKFILKKSNLPKDKFYIFLLIMIPSLILSFLNPNGWIVFLMFQSKYQIFTSGIQEYRPLFEFYLKNVSRIDYALLFIVSITAITLLIRFIKMQLSHIILLGGMFIMGLLQQRYFIFSATIGMIIVGKELASLYRYVLKRTESPNYDKFEKVTVSLIVLFMFFFAGKTSLAIAKNIRNLSVPPVVDAPRGAIEFIERNKIPGRLFNTDLIGGYAIWRLYPWKQVFTDTRAIDIASAVEYKNIVAANPAIVGGKPVWEILLDMYNVTIVVTNPLDYYGNLLPLVKSIIENERWALVYTDGNYLVFVKRNKENQEIISRHPLTKEDAYWSIIAKASFMALSNTDNPYLFSVIGECFMGLKIYEEAEKAFKHVLRIEPDNMAARKAIDEIHIIKKKKNKG